MSHNVDVVFNIHVTCWLFPSLRSRAMAASSSVNLLRVVLTSLWRSLYSWYWSLKTARYFSLSSTQLISGYLLLRCISDKDYHVFVCLFLQSRHFLGRLLLTWCSLQWCVLWVYIQTPCSVRLHSHGLQVSQQTGCLYPEVCLFHLWMIFSFFLEGSVGWAVEKNKYVKYIKSSIILTLRVAWDVDQDLETLSE